MNLTIKPVRFGDKKVKEIYRDAFSKEDRMPFGLMLLMSMSKQTDFLSFYSEERLCGFVYLANMKDIVFVMFLAVDRTIRSKGYGSGMLEQIQMRYPNQKIIMSIERCDEEANNIEQRLRRKKFYMNNGYLETGYLIELGNSKQEVIIKNGVFDKEEFLLFLKEYSNGTLKPKIWEMHKQ